MFKVAPPRTAGTASPESPTKSPLSKAANSPTKVVEEEVTFGKKFIALGKNIFSRTDQAQKEKDLAKQEKAQRELLSSFFKDVKQKDIFYGQAKDGKKDADAKDVNQMMLKYFMKVSKESAVPSAPLA